MSTRSATSASSGSVGGGGGARRGHKERSKNFTELEKRTVLELIARHRDVLRQGRSNNATNRSKQVLREEDRRLAFYHLTSHAQSPTTYGEILE
ncbi:hypothetical protein EVAR_94621_1 [Eumeta japonica]|uniref:Regulatory protein zeste n=1 Tax=Eumeta variegata TaxID=151549 RepID=A0A4C1UTJ0_EUMVA|nr:hypothetical protein EVAR_94621_1 [Eumeta japonica]